MSAKGLKAFAGRGKKHVTFETVDGKTVAKEHDTKKAAKEYGMELRRSGKDPSATMYSKEDAIKFGMYKQHGVKEPADAKPVNTPGGSDKPGAGLKAFAGVKPAYTMRYPEAPQTEAERSKYIKWTFGSPERQDELSRQRDRERAANAPPAGYVKFGEKPQDEFETKRSAAFAASEKARKTGTPADHRAAATANKEAAKAAKKAGPEFKKQHENYKFEAERHKSTAEQSTPGDLKLASEKLRGETWTARNGMMGYGRMLTPGKTTYDRLRDVAAKHKEIGEKILKHDPDSARGKSHMKEAERNSKTADGWKAMNKESEGSDSWDESKHPRDDQGKFT